MRMHEPALRDSRTDKLYDLYRLGSRSITILFHSHAGSIDYCAIRANDIEHTLMEDLLRAVKRGGGVCILDAGLAAWILALLKHSRNGHVSEDIVELAVPAGEGIALACRVSRSLRSLAVRYLLLIQQGVIPVLEANSKLARRKYISKVISSLFVLAQ